MTMMASIVLRDIHQPPAPSWWPPAPGWWLVALVILGVLAGAWAWSAYRRRRRRRIEALFDDAVGAAETPAVEVATMSELLRRAARRRDPAADRLQGEAWLDFLDAGRKLPDFSAGIGALLLDGGYRREVDPRQVEALRVLARARFLDWMGVR
jgi:hypothetical protein